MINSIHNMGTVAGGLGPLGPDYSTLVLPDSPYVYWNLDEASGITNGSASVVDSSGNGRTGTYFSSGATSLSATGAKRNPNTRTAFNFADSSVYVKLTNPYAGANITASYLECWFRLSTTGQPEEFIMGMTQNVATTYPGASIGIKGKRMVIRQIGSSDLNAQSYVGPEVLDTNWHHVYAQFVTGVADSHANTSITAILYLDGYLVTDSTLSTSVATLAGAPDFNVGGTSYTHPKAARFSGLIDEAAAYSAPLSAARVLAHIGTPAVLTNRNHLRASDRLLDSAWNLILGLTRTPSEQASPLPGGTGSVIDLKVSSTGSSDRYFAAGDYPFRAGVAFVASCYVKVIAAATPVDHFCVAFSDGVVYGAFSVFNISTGVFVAHYNSGGGATNANPVITAVPGFPGWYRISVSHTPAVTSWRGNVQFQPCVNSATPRVYAADIGDGAHMTSPSLHYGTSPDAYAGTPGAPDAGIQLDAFQGLAVMQVELGDMQLDAFQGLAVVQIGEGGDVQLDAFQGLAIVQTTYP